METIAKIRRLHFVQHKSVSAIARDLGFSRNTVRKFLRQDPAEPKYRRQVQVEPKLGPYRERLEAWLTAEAALPAKQRRTARRLFEALQAEGYIGAYDSVQRFVKAWSGPPSVRAAYIPQCFRSGEAYQFDWSCEWVELAGVVQAVKVAHFRLAYSRMPFLVAYPRETQEMVFDAHNHAFAFFGGVPERGIYDNLKTCVDAVYVGKARRFNPRFLALMNHYLVEPTACTPAAGWEKGQVENQVGTLREWLFTPRPRFASLADLNAHLAARCRALAGERAHPEFPERRIADVFAEEQASLRAIAQPFDGYLERDVRVSSTCLVQCDRNRYSVDARYAQRVVRLRLYPERLVVLADDTVIAEHGREFGRDKTVYNPWHYLPLLARKPGALRNGAPFAAERLPAALAQVQQRLRQRPGGDRAMVEVLLACQGEQLEAVLTACELALTDGTVSADVILNLAHRLQAPLPPAPLTPPLGLHLHQDILTDCSRYDRLRPSQAVTHAH